MYFSQICIYTIYHMYFNQIDSFEINLTYCNIVCIYDFVHTICNILHVFYESFFQDEIDRQTKSDSFRKPRYKLSEN